MNQQQFQTWYNTLDANQRVDWMNFASKSGKASPKQTAAAVKEFARQNYGAIAAYLDDPELGPILMKAGRQGWSAARLQGAISKTKFWKTTPASMREWGLLQKTDPATVKQKIGQMSGNIRALLSREGVTLPDVRIATLAEQILASGADPSMVPKMVLAEIAYNPTHPVGELGARMDQYAKRASDYAVSMADTTTFDWAKKVAMGDASDAGVDEYLRQLAETRFSRNADMVARLKEGFTTRELLDDPINQVSKLLEIDPDKIDLTSDKYAPIAEFADQQGNIRSMTAAEAGNYARTQDEYQHTDNGRQSAASLADFLGKKLGAAA